MSALSNQQFRGPQLSGVRDEPIERVGKMLSLDYLGQTVEQHATDPQTGSDKWSIGDEHSGLVGDIAKNGQEQPVEVRYIHKTGEQVFTHGHNRYEAMKRLGRKTIKVNHAGRLSNQETSSINYGLDRGKWEGSWNG